VAGDPAVTEPTPLQLQRQLDNTNASLTARMADLTTDLKDDRKVYATREQVASLRELVESWRDNDRSDIAELKQGRETDAAWRRTMFLGIGTATFVALVSIAIAIFTYLGSK